MRTYFPVFVKDISIAVPRLMATCSRSWDSVRFAARSASPARQHQEEGRVALGALIAWRGHFRIWRSKSLPAERDRAGAGGASMMAVFATVNSLVQLITTNEMRGRVMSVYNFAFRAACRWGICCRMAGAYLYCARGVGVNGFLLIVLALYFLLIQRKMAASDGEPGFPLGRDWRGRRRSVVPSLYRSSLRPEFNALLLASHSHHHRCQREYNERSQRHGVRVTRVLGENRLDVCNRTASSTPH